jgi:hypothetical protein
MKRENVKEWWKEWWKELLLIINIFLLYLKIKK